jgi:uncharacterized protein
MLKEDAQLTLDPKRSAEKKEALEGTLPLESLDLPAEVLGSPIGEIHYKLGFGKDGENYVFIQGEIETALTLECQRCLKPIEHKVKSEFCLSPVKNSSEAEALPERYDPVLAEGEKLTLLQIVEEELILSLPLVPLHETECHFQG